MKRNSIGNDIVALNAVNKERSVQPKFFSKFLTETELALYNGFKFSISFLEFIWVCWSIKESVYKFQKRLQPQLAFSYKRFLIQRFDFSFCKENLFSDKIINKNLSPVKNQISSITTINDVEFYTYSFITNHVIYSMTFETEDPGKLYWEIKEINDALPANQSLHVRNISTQKIKNILGDIDFDIVKSEIGYPYIAQHAQIPLSFTHHENYIGYCFIV